MRMHIDMGLFLCNTKRRLDAMNESVSYSCSEKVDNCREEYYALGVFELDSNQQGDYGSTWVAYSNQFAPANVLDKKCDD